MVPLIIAEADIGKIIVGLIWFGIVLIGWISNAVKKAREKRADSEWETETEWQDPAPVDAAAAQARQQAEQQAARERLEREARVQAIREREARIQQQEAIAGQRRDHQHADSQAVDPAINENIRMLEAAEAMEQNLKRQKAAAKRAAAKLARKSAAGPAGPSIASTPTEPLLEEDGTPRRRRKSWVASMKRSELQRAMVMTEVFDRPRCFDT